MKTVSQKAYVTLISTLIIGAVGVAVAVSLLLLGLGSSRTSLAVSQSDQAKAMANACAEDAMEKVRESSSYTGSSSLTIGSNTCTYTVTLSGGNSIVTASGTAGTILRKINVSFGVSGISWLEVP